MYEILQQPPYRHLRVLKDYEEEPNVWHARMAHHTIDPQDPESIGLVKSLIDQTLPFYRTDLFNICCDETFDLLARYPDKAGEMYVGFVERIMAHLRGKGKRIMMWADILLRHPETIEKLPAETLFLNWAYGIPDESKIKKLADLGRRQIVCPGTSAWNRFAENVEKVDAAFHGKVNDLLYQRPDGWECLKAVSDMNDLVSWTQFVKNSFFHRAGERERMVFPDRETPERVQALYDGLRERLPEGEEDIYRRSLRLAAEGICAVAELTAKAAGYDLPEKIRVAKWLAAYRQNWLRDNKESELRRIEEIFRYFTAGANRDGLGIRLAAEMMRGNHAEHRLLVVLSDCKPNDPLMVRDAGGVYRNYEKDLAVEDTAAEVHRARLDGISVVCVYTGSDEDLTAAKRIYGQEFTRIRTLSQFADRVARLLKEGISAI